MNNLTPDVVNFYCLICSLIMFGMYIIFQILNSEIRHEWQIKQEGNKFTPQKKIFKRWSILNETINYVKFDTLHDADYFIGQKKQVLKVTIHKR